MKHLYIVIYRCGGGKWKPEPHGVCEDRAMAGKMIEVAKHKGETFEFAIVEGPIVSAETMAEAEARLGAF
jgi:hypothetical protein